jgi:hypothetical protein
MGRFDDEIIGIGFLAVATPAQAGETKVLKSKESGSFVSANLVNDFAPDPKMKTCTGCPAELQRRNWVHARGISCGYALYCDWGSFVFQGNLRHGYVRISPRSQRPLSRSSTPRQGLLLVARVRIPERLAPSQVRSKERC